MSGLFRRPFRIPPRRRIFIGSLPKAYTIIAAQGSYVLSGQAADFIVVFALLEVEPQAVELILSTQATVEYSSLEITTTASLVLDTTAKVPTEVIPIVADLVFETSLIYATKSRIFNFLANGEGFIGYPGADTTMQWDVTDQRLETTTSGRNKTNTSYWEWTGTWASLLDLFGVDEVQYVVAQIFDGVQDYIGPINSTRIGPIEIRASDDNLIAALLPYRVPDINAPGEERTGTYQSIPPEYQLATTGIKIYVEHYINLGNADPNSLTQFIDDLKIHVIHLKVAVEIEVYPDPISLVLASEQPLVEEVLELTQYVSLVTSTTATVQLGSLEFTEVVDLVIETVSPIVDYGSLELSPAISLVTDTTATLELGSLALTQTVSLTTSTLTNVELGSLEFSPVVSLFLITLAQVEQGSIEVTESAELFFSTSVYVEYGFVEITSVVNLIVDIYNPLTIFGELNIIPQAVEIIPDTTISVEYGSLEITDIVSLVTTTSIQVEYSSLELSNIASLVTSTIVEIEYSSLELSAVVSLVTATQALVEYGELEFSPWASLTTSTIATIELGSIELSAWVSLTTTTRVQVGYASVEISTYVELVCATQAIFEYGSIVATGYATLVVDIYNPLIIFGELNILPQAVELIPTTVIEIEYGSLELSSLVSLVTSTITSVEYGLLEISNTVYLVTTTIDPEFIYSGIELSSITELVTSVYNPLVLIGEAWILPQAVEISFETIAIVEYGPVGITDTAELYFDTVAQIEYGALDLSSFVIVYLTGEDPEIILFIPTIITPEAITLVAIGVNPIVEYGNLDLRKVVELVLQTINPDLFYSSVEVQQFVSLVTESFANISLGELTIYGLVTIDLETIAPYVEHGSVYVSPNISLIPTVVTPYLFFSSTTASAIVELVTSTTAKIDALLRDQFDVELGIIRMLDFELIIVTRMDLDMNVVRGVNLDTEITKEMDFELGVTRSIDFEVDL